MTIAIQRIIAHGRLGVRQLVPAEGLTELWQIATGLASDASAYNVPFEGTIAGRTCRDMLKIESSIAEFYDTYCDVCLRSPG